VFATTESQTLIAYLEEEALRKFDIMAHVALRAIQQLYNFITSIYRNVNNGASG
jgi:hypothetical protein